MLPSIHRHRLGLVSVALVGVAAFAVASPGCGGDEPAEPKPQGDGTTSSAGAGGGNGDGDGDCTDGVKTEDGKCEPRCDPKECFEGNTCVGNRCVLVCDSHLDCYLDGTQDCTPAKEDGTGKDVAVCLPNGKVAGPGFFTTPCPFGDECARHACPDGRGCEPEACDDEPGDCKESESRCKGADPEACNLGKCGDSGVACYTKTCDTGDCETTKATCKSAGMGDADAY